MRLITSVSMSLFAALALTGPAHADKKGPVKGGDMEFEPENASATPASKTLERAIKLYDKKDFFSASIELKKVLDGESGDDAKNKQRGEFFMGKTLYQMGFYAGSLAYFDKIVQAGDAHTYHGAALKWLAALSRVLPETSGILEKIGTYDVSALNDPSLQSVHDELLFEVPDKEIDKTKDLTRKVMEGAAKLSVPLVVDTGVGDNWAAAH